MSGKQIKLFLVDGTAGGLTTAEITNWTGHVLAARRSDLSDLLQREEAQRTGVYFLVGADDDAIEGTRLYIGEADDVAQRLKRHESNKRWEWTRVVLVTSKDSNITKAHARYLESRLISMADAGHRVTLVNSDHPPLPSLPEADRSDMDYFLDQFQIVLPVLGVNAFRGRKASNAQSSPSGTDSANTPTPSTPPGQDSPVFVLRRAKRGVSLRAQQIDGEFTVFEGSEVVPRWDSVGRAATVKRSYAALRARHEKLVADGTIAIKGSRAVLTRDVPFDSPSGAGAVFIGRSCNGRTEWIMEEPPHLQFGQWESRGVDAA